MNTDTWLEGNTKDMDTGNRCSYVKLERESTQSLQVQENQDAENLEATIKLR